ncbi:MAG: IS1634 family transposase [Nitrospirae bacterium]|nr:IS1634 family transposase [Nitrospirota bacterium]
MKKFTRIKVINGKEYIYEITPYYDPETKKIRHKSRYLGKNVEGHPVRVRDKLPQRAYTYGEVLVFAEIIRELGIKEILKEHLSKDELTLLLALVLNRATYPLALRHIGSWYEGTYLYERSLKITSQKLSRLLEKIGRSNLGAEFSKALLGRLKTRGALIYDITSLSSYSQCIEILEWGYNRDGDELPQANLSLVVDRAEGIPVMYEVYPGSIVDVSTLVNTVEVLRSYGIEDCMMVLDRGFFSRANICLLEERGIEYIIAASLSLKSVRGAMSSAQKLLSDPNNMKLYNNEPLFVAEVEVEVGGLSVKGYCYYNPQRQKSEQERFYRRLYGIKEALEGRGLSRTSGNVKELVEDIAGQYRKYLWVDIHNGGIRVRFRNKAISQRVNRMGRFLILYRGDIDWQECLAAYRGKELIEKGFDILKNDLEIYTPNVQKEETLRGLLFAGFISLILRMRLMKKMKETGLSRHYSVTGLLTELSKLKMIELTNGQRITTEQTKKHKEIFNKLNLCA